jgi:hypothetical protein
MEETTLTWTAQAVDGFSELIPQSGHKTSFQVCIVPLPIAECVRDFPNPDLSADNHSNNTRFDPQSIHSLSVQELQTTLSSQ